MALPSQSKKERGSGLGLFPGLQRLRRFGIPQGFWAPTEARHGSGLVAGEQGKGDSDQWLSHHLPSSPASHLLTHRETPSSWVPG